MKNSLIALAIIGSFSLPMAAQAASAENSLKDRLTVSIGYEHSTTETGTEDLNLGVADTTVNYKFNDVFGAEVQLGSGLIDGDVAGTNVDVDYTSKVALTGAYPLSDRVSALGELGYMTQKKEMTTLGVTTEDDVEGWGYSMGLGYQLKEANIDLSIEYNDMISVDDAESYTLAGTYNFAGTPFAATVEFTAPFDDDNGDYQTVRTELSYKF